jgi:hypothetical protein
METIRTTTWGGPERHYSTPIEQGSKQASLTTAQQWQEIGNRWARFLTQYHPQLLEEVSQACKQWNNAVRDHLRAETALRLTIGDESQAVPVRVVDGMPRRFAEELQDFGGFEALLLNRPLLQAAVQGNDFLEKNLQSVRNLLAVDSVATDSEVKHVHLMAQALIDKLDEMKILKSILGIEEDVLGAYYFHLPEVQIYWVPIGIVASALGLSTSALTLVVLAHELAHAYTHLGRDIDKERWDTSRFSQADVTIIEGLAQFYTGVVCKKLEQRMPAALNTYQELLKFQTGPYKAHLAWVPEDQQGREIIRVSMIECRSQGITASEAFAEVLRRHGRQIRRTRTPTSTK